MFLTHCYVRSFMLTTQIAMDQDPGAGLEKAPFLEVELGGLVLLCQHQNWHHSTSPRQQRSLQTWPPWTTTPNKHGYITTHAGHVQSHQHTYHGHLDSIMSHIINTHIPTAHCELYALCFCYQSLISLCNCHSDILDPVSVFFSVFWFFPWLVYTVC